MDDAMRAARDPIPSMTELDRARLEKQSKWTPEEALAAALTDIRNEDGKEGKCVSVMIMMVVETPRGTVQLPWYNGGFRSCAEQLGYLMLFKDRLIAWWKNDS